MNSLDGLQKIARGNRIGRFMFKLKGKFKCLLLLLLTACRPAPTSPLSPTPPPIQAFTQFSPGDTVDLLRIKLNLDYYEVRYRASMPPDEMGAVYFLEDGNLHVDAKKIGDTWVLISIPVLEPSTLTAAARVAAWDRACDPQSNPSRSQR
jgi:hypothetical protein